jgi:hypothetical protein
VGRLRLQAHEVLDHSLDGQLGSGEEMVPREGRPVERALADDG